MHFLSCAIELFYIANKREAFYYGHPNPPCHTIHNAIPKEISMSHIITEVCHTG